MFEYAYAYRIDVYQAMVGGRGGPVALAEMRRVLSDFYRDDEVPRELTLQFVVGGFLTVLGWCLEKKPKMTPTQAVAMFSHLVIQGAGPLLTASLFDPATTRARDRFGSFSPVVPHRR